MASAVTAYHRAFGSDAPPTYDDVPEATAHLVWGANPAVAHPVLYRWLLDSATEAGCELIVVDPVESETATETPPLEYSGSHTGTLPAFVPKTDDTASQSLGFRSDLWEIRIDRLPTRTIRRPPTQLPRLWWTVVGLEMAFVHNHDGSSDR